jgi:hypothetical protein
MQYALPHVLPDVPAGGVCTGIDWATADHAARSLEKPRHAGRSRCRLKLSVRT